MKNYQSEPLSNVMFVTYWLQLLNTKYCKKNHGKEMSAKSTLWILTHFWDIQNTFFYQCLLVEIFSNKAFSFIWYPLVVQYFLQMFSCGIVIHQSIWNHLYQDKSVDPVSFAASFNFWKHVLQDELSFKRWHMCCIEEGAAFHSFDQYPVFCHFFFW